MSRSQPVPMSPQKPGDNGASDFVSALQQNLTTLFQDAHIHGVKTAPPRSTDGSIGDICLVDDGTTGKLYIKFPTLGWLSVTAS